MTDENKNDTEELEVLDLSKLSIKEVKEMMLAQGDSAAVKEQVRRQRANQKDSPNKGR
ncbi:MAG: hypothetical protein JKY42_00150 [Flavobacteriales bacterium]|nr:hypothetical protein [Flavobacteriales bacterium]